MAKIPESYKEISNFREQFEHYEGARDFIIEYVYPQGRFCNHHNKEMQLVYARDRPTVWKCSTGKHQKSLLFATPLRNCRIGLEKVLQILLHFWVQTPRLQTSQLIGVHRNTVSYYYSLGEAVLCSYSVDTIRPIGGPGITVEIDECVIHRRKYHKGRQKKQIWIFGAVEVSPTGNQGDFFLTKVPNRSATTLIPIINEFIKKGSIICSDEWKAYNQIPNEYIHRTVCHKTECSDPETGTNTNMIEGLWSQLRRTLPKRRIPDHLISQLLGQFMGRKNNDISFVDFIRLLCYYKEEVDSDAEEKEQTEQLVPDDVACIAEIESDSDTDPLGLQEGLYEEEYQDV